MSASDLQRPIVVGLNGYGVQWLPGVNGREGVDAIGSGIVEGINAKRADAGLPPFQNAYRPLEGGNGVDRRELRKLMSLFAEQPADGLILIGYSDGATTIHREFRKGYAREALGEARLTFVGFMDMVRVHNSIWAIGVNIFSDQQVPLRDAELISSGGVYYQNSGLWKGFARIGNLESRRFDGLDHLTIDQSERVQQAVIQDAVNAYRPQ